MKRRVIRFFLWVATIIVAIWIFQKLDIIPSAKDFFSSKPVVIDQTPIIIKEVRSIAQLITVTSYDEVVVDSVIIQNGPRIKNFLNHFSPYPILSIDKKIVLIVRGKVLAGTDLTIL